MSDQIVSGVRDGKHRAIGRAISIVESDRAERDDLIARLDPDGTARGTVRILGVTGPPGAGKSTLIAALIVEARRAGEKVGVLAVDPSSPFSGGALLGDRLRMNRHGTDGDVYIRSMATRGHGGGLSAAALDAATILGAAGFDLVLVESVGVGQSEIGILAVADVVAVVLNPGTGDEIQAIKAGIMEIGDIYVVNKADLEGAADLERVLRRAELRAPGTSLPPVIVASVAETGQGIADLLSAVNDRVAALQESGDLDLRRDRGVVAAAEQLAGDLFRDWIREHQMGGATAIPFGELRRRIRGALEAVAASAEDGGDADD